MTVKEYEKLLNDKYAISLGAGLYDVAETVISDLKSLSGKLATYNFITYYHLHNTSSAQMFTIIPNLDNCFKYEKFYNRPIGAIDVRVWLSSGRVKEIMIDSKYKTMQEIANKLLKMLYEFENKNITKISKYYLDMINAKTYLDVDVIEKPEELNVSADKKVCLQRDLIKHKVKVKIRRLQNE